MLFNSPYFLFVFLPITYLVFWHLQEKQSRLMWLTLTGYWFYSCWNWKFLFLMLFSTVVSYTAGLCFLRFDLASDRTRRWILAVPITIDLLLLGFFKYFNFALDSTEKVFQWAGLHLPATHLDIILPVGISFYTFHTISYIVDSYRRQIRPTRNFWEFACYVSLFSQLVAGPIVRFGQVENDLEQVAAQDQQKNISRAVGFFCLGLIKKVLIADTLAPLADQGFALSGQLSCWHAWVTALTYTFQLYFDFSGYSDMAVGLGLLFNIHIPQNFASPYKSHSITEFWRRWHITLSNCIRDYIYIPLGGNRASAPRVIVNLLLAMGIAGLWHGAQWTFVIWGLYHGFLLTFERLWRQKAVWHLRHPGLQRVITFILVVFGWVIFRSATMTEAFALFANMFGVQGRHRLNIPYGAGLLLVLCGWITQTQDNSFEIAQYWSAWRTPVWVAGFTLVMAFILSGQATPFLYFQF